MKKLINYVSLRGAFFATKQSIMRLLRALRSFAMTREMGFYFFLLVFCFPAFANGQNQAVADFAAGRAAYTQGQYPQAISAYEKIRKDGVESGGLYYNLANSYYRNGQTGYAALNYERAAQLIPRDRDLKYNYRYVLSRYPEAQPVEAKNIFRQALDKHIEFYTLDEMILILVILFVFAGLFGLAAYRWQWPSTTVKIVSTVLVTVFLIYGAGFDFKIWDGKGKAVVVSPVSANFEPRTSATAHYQLPEGAIVHIVKDDNGWLKVRRWDDKLGWIPKDKIEIINAK